MRTVGSKAGAASSGFHFTVLLHAHRLEDREEILNPLAGSSLRQGYGWQACCQDWMRTVGLNAEVALRGF